MTTSVDFDYNGPPVCVSNGMALQLVSQFGIRNAWHAFLRMRGMKVNSEESNKAVDSFKYFRNKIGKLRREIQEMKGQKVKGMEKDEQMLGEKFDTFLATQNSLELREDAEEYPEVDEREFEEGKSDVDEKAKETQTVTAIGEEPVGAADAIGASDQSAMEAAASLVQKIKEQQRIIDEQKRVKMGAVTSLENVITKTTATDVNSKQSGAEQLAKKDGKISQHLQDERKDEIARRHAETIDDVVSLVLEKIRSNQPFEGELNLASSSATQMHRFLPTTRNSLKSQKASVIEQRPATTAIGHGKRTYKEETVHGRGTQQQKQQHFTTQTEEFSPPLPSSQSIFFLHSPSASQRVSSPHSTTSALVHQPKDKHETHPSVAVTTTLSNLSEIMRSSSSNPIIATPIHHQQTQSTVSCEAVQSQFTTKLLAQQQQSIQFHPQQQQQHFLIGAENASDLMVNVSGIPLELAIQQGMTVQELIQTLKMQNRQQQQQQVIFSHSQLPLPQHQQDVPDSSSTQEANQRDISRNPFDTMAKGKPTPKMARKSRKRKEITPEKGEEERKNAQGEDNNGSSEAKAQRKGRRPKQQKTTTSGMEQGPKVEEQMANEQRDEETKGGIVQHERTELQRPVVSEMEVHLKKVQKQLTIEQNKVMGLKKRVDKLQIELNKNVDTIQLLQIDLACLKTDNNNLISENIALKAENQQLRSKGTLSVGHRKNATPSTSNVSSGRSGAGTLRGRRKANGRDGKERNGKQKQLEKAVSLPERTRTPPPLSSELGRRQSKRICVARSQFLKTTY